MQTGAACYVCVQHSACHFMLLCYALLCFALLFCMKLFYANMLLHSFVRYTLVQRLAIAIKGQRAAQGLSGAHWRCALSAV